MPADQGFDHGDESSGSRCRICRRPFHPQELDEDILRNLGACSSCAQEEEDHEYARRAELDGDYDDDDGYLEPDDPEDRP